MADIPLLIPEINYALPEADGERINVSIPSAWLPFVVKTLTEITDADLHTGSEALHIANRYKIDTVLAGLEIVGGGMFIGAVVPHALATVPANLLVCDGATYDRVDYPDLYAALHSAFILDADHFKVPDLRDKFVKGEWASQAIGTTGGDKTVTLTTDQIPAHNHDIGGSTGGSTIAPAVSIALSSTGANNTTVVESKGGGQAHNNEPQFYVLRYAIVASL